MLGKSRVRSAKATAALPAVRATALREVTRTAQPGRGWGPGAGPHGSGSCLLLRGRVTSGTDCVSQCQGSTGTAPDKQQHPPTVNLPLPPRPPPGFIPTTTSGGRRDETARFQDRKQSQGGGVTGPAKGLQMAVAQPGHRLPRREWPPGLLGGRGQDSMPVSLLSLSLSLLLAATSQAPSPKEPDTGGPSGSLWTGGVSLPLGMKGGRGNGANSSQQHSVSVCTH